MGVDGISSRRIRQRTYNRPAFGGGLRTPSYRHHLLSSGGVRRELNVLRGLFFTAHRKKSPDDAETSMARIALAHCIP